MKRRVSPNQPDDIREMVGADGELLVPVADKKRKRLSIWVFAAISFVVIFVLCAIVYASSSGAPEWHHNPDFYAATNSADELDAFSPTMVSADVTPTGCTERRFYGTVHAGEHMEVLVYRDSGRHAGNDITDENGNYSVAIAAQQPEPMYVRLYDLEGNVQGVMGNIPLTGEYETVCNVRIDFWPRAE
jgi:hypothetical protein